MAPLFFLCFFAAIDAALWAIQTSAAVSATEQATRLAAAAAGSPESNATPAPPALFAAVHTQLQQAMFGTTVVAWCDPAGMTCPSAAGGGGRAAVFARCPATPDEVEVQFGPRTVAVCDETAPASPPCPAAPLPSPPRCGDPPTVTVRVVGFLASLVPPMSALGWHAGEIPVNIVATSHTLRFAP